MNVTLLCHEYRAKHQFIEVRAVKAEKENVSVPVTLQGLMSKPEVAFKTPFIIYTSLPIGGILVKFYRLVKAPELLELRSIDVVYVYKNYTKKFTITVPRVAEEIKSSGMIWLPYPHSIPCEVVGASFTLRYIYRAAGPPPEYIGALVIVASLIICGGLIYATVTRLRRALSRIADFV